MQNITIHTSPHSTSKKHTFMCMCSVLPLESPFLKTKTNSLLSTTAHLYSSCFSWDLSVVKREGAEKSRRKRDLKINKPQKVPPPSCRHWEALPWLDRLHHTVTWLTQTPEDKTIGVCSHATYAKVTLLLWTVLRGSAVAHGPQTSGKMFFKTIT